MGAVVPASCREAWLRSPAGMEDFPTPEAAAGFLLEPFSSWEALEGFSLEVIPLQRINCGAKGNRYHAHPSRLRAMLHHYQDADANPQIRRVAVRVWLDQERENTLLSRMYLLDASTADRVNLGVTQGETECPSADPKDQDPDDALIVDFSSTEDDLDPPSAPTPPAQEPAATAKAMQPAAPEVRPLSGMAKFLREKNLLPEH